MESIKDNRGNTVEKEGIDNGFDFMNDLLVCYDKNEAIRIANSYLDMQAHVYGCSTEFMKKNPEEYAFCVELYQATRQAKGL